MGSIEGGRINERFITPGGASNGSTWAGQLGSQPLLTGEGIVEKRRNRMNQQAERQIWGAIIVIVVVILSMTGRVGNAASSACPCWDIEEVRQEVLDSAFPCETMPKKEVRDGAEIAAAVAQSLPFMNETNNGQSFHLEAYLIKVKEKQKAQEKYQAWCKCFSNSEIRGCVEDEVNDLDYHEGQACIKNMYNLCKDIHKNMRKN
jgi:hypothetical protein